MLKEHLHESLAEAAVPRILGKQSRAASEITGITAAIPIL